MTPDALSLVTACACPHLVQGFDDGARLLEVADRRGLEGIVSKRQASAYRSGPHAMGEDQNRRMARCEPGAVAIV
jgi:hypothetical protein